VPPVTVLKSLGAMKWLRLQPAVGGGGGETAMEVVLLEPGVIASGGSA